MIGAKLKTLRAKNRFTQTELAAALGIHQTSVAAWETDRTMPDYENIIKLCTLFGVSMDSMFDFSVETADIWRDFGGLTAAQKKIIYTMIKSFIIVNKSGKKIEN
ncbi:MAG: helix-turn-helix transcriptional regulator [Negativicutes bacterium]|jgi:transcriptional regulator with XRE-family HTH domain